MALWRYDVMAVFGLNFPLLFKEGWPGHLII